MKNLFLGFIALFVFTLGACNATSEKKAEDDVNVSQEATASKENNAVNGQGNFSELFSHYRHLTFALSSDNDEEATNAAKGMLEALSKIKTEGFTTEQKTSFDHIAADIQEQSEHIADNKGDIAHQRAHLVTLSKRFYDIAKEFGTEKPMYKVFCSMYDNNKGAFWLSDSKEIKNPYYGEEMLSCGEVQEELK
ncbi:MULTISPECIES: DUF3347 domain-containing protein [Sphingobacterium]|uniref:DUF3347 domain-containing protein n=1 Tax=Sphingobacterium TaxID=28453 RepID=UPI001F0986BA|nr:MULTISPECIES: DUF3347 domain-containing protein [unclassified Sphingobacterium]